MLCYWFIVAKNYVKSENKRGRRVGEDCVALSSELSEGRSVALTLGDGVEGVAVGGAVGVFGVTVLRLEEPRRKKLINSFLNDHLLRPVLLLLLCSRLVLLFPATADGVAVTTG